MRRIAATAAGVLALLAVAACGSDAPPETPLACLEPAPAYLRALEAAPGEVLLDGTTPISDCLVEEQGPGAQAQAGEAMIVAATRLNRELRRELDRPTAVSLGYLVGAVQEGAAATGGIHADLVRRLDAAARYPEAGGEPFPASFERAFGAGYAAGQESG
ncbi:MAG: hypothetical protein ACRDKX_04300 [Solirubrobacterales bacterium]